MDFLKSDKLNTGFVAGLGSGKSFVSTLKVILKKIKYPKSKIAYYLPTYGLVKDIAFDKFPEMLDFMGYQYVLNKSDKEIHIKDFGKIIFRSMDQPENIVGYETFYTVIDECDILPMQKMTTAYNKILARNRQVLFVEDEVVLNSWSIPMKLPKYTYYHKEMQHLCWENQLDIVGTPEGYKFFYNRYVEEFNEETDLLVRASTYENKHLPANYIKSLQQQYTKELLDAYLNGNFVNLTSGNIFYTFNRDSHDTDIVENESEEIHISQDFNVGGCVSCVYIKRNDKLLQVDEFESYDTHSIVSNINNRYPNRPITIYPDASGNNRSTKTSDTDIQILQEAGFYVIVNNANPRVEDRINITNNCFEKKKVLVNTNRCPKTTKMYEQWGRDEKGQPEKYTGAGTIDDYGDAATYILCHIFPIQQQSFKREVKTY